MLEHVLGDLAPDYLWQNKLLEFCFPFFLLFRETLRGTSFDKAMTLEHAFCDLALGPLRCKPKFAGGWEVQRQTGSLATPARGYPPCSLCAWGVGG